MTVIVTVLLFFINLFLLTLVFSLQWLSLHLEVLIICYLSFHWLSMKLKKRCPSSSHNLLLFSCWLSLWLFEKFSLGEYIGNAEWVRLGINVYIFHRKYQVKPHSSQRFSAAGSATVVRRNHFFCLYQRTNRMNYVHLKWNSGRLVIVSKEFLKLPNFDMLIKQKSLSLPWNLALTTFHELLLMLSTKAKCAMSPCCFPLPIKQKFLRKTFLGTRILSTQISFYLLSLLVLTWNYIIFM